MSTTPIENDGIMFEAGETIRAKWLMDGCKTLEEAAARLEGFASMLRRAHDAGWTLSQPIEDDYGHLVDPTGNSGWLDEEEWDEDEEGWGEEE